MIRTMRNLEKVRSLIPGNGHCGAYENPKKIWNSCVPKRVIGLIRNGNEETSKDRVHPVTQLCKTSC